MQPIHLPRIDILRAFAILLVFNSHFWTAVHGNPGFLWDGLWFRWADSPGILAQALRLSVLDGRLGVCLFFVISGLCIRLSHKSVTGFSVSHFYWRRFWRIYPPYLAVLITCVLVQSSFNEVGFENFLLHGLLSHNFSKDYFYSINGPFWSLALEFQVYLLYPLLLLLHERIGKWRAGSVFLVLAVVSTIVGGETFRTKLHLSENWEVVRQLPTTLWFTWYMGFLLAEKIVAGEKPTGASRAILMVSVCLVPFFRFFRPAVPFELPLAGVVLSLLSWEFLSIPKSHWSPRLVNWLGYLGLCSYSFYLCFDKLIRPILKVTSIGVYPQIVQWTIGYLITLIAIACVSFGGYWVLERQSIAFGRRLWMPKRSSQTQKIPRKAEACVVRRD